MRYLIDILCWVITLPCFCFVWVFLCICAAPVYLCIHVFVCWSSKWPWAAKPHVNKLDWIRLNYQYIQDKIISLAIFYFDSYNVIYAVCYLMRYVFIIYFLCVCVFGLLLDVFSSRPCAAPVIILVVVVPAH